MTDATFPSRKVTPAFPYRVDKLVPPPHPDSEKTEPSAQVRLEASRARVRGALMEIAHPPKRPGSGAGAMDKLTDMVKDVPGVTLVLHAAQSWWDEHGQTARTAGRVSQALVAPVARRHPTSLLGIAAALGALLVLFKPWRILLRRKVLFRAASLIATQAIRGRSASSWLQAVMKFAGSRKRARY